MAAKRGRRWIAWAILLAVVLAAVWSTAIEPGLLRVRSVVLESPHWPAQRPPLRVVFIADLHVGAPHVGLDKVDDVVAEANATHPDLILLGGDFIGHVLGGSAVPPEEICAQIDAGLAAPLDGSTAILREFRPGRGFVGALAVTGGVERLEFWNAGAIR